ncbi:hypothetical protein [Pseudotamlana agarivorans]|uniref:hypothetical protein n=1 Tax=Pseudotamlana agarivorans TaxID=481183 RepID=UPI00083626C0|nr:hypothetical protein [Tamlana agarivorans]
MRYFKIIITLVCLYASSCSNNDDSQEKPDYTPGDIDFVKTFGGSLNDSGKSIIKTNDGGYAVFGHTQSNDLDVTNKPDDSFDYWLLKFNQNNELEWQKSYGGSLDDRGTSCILTSDGGYAIFGYSQSSDRDVSENNGATDFWMTKLNTTGDILWEKSFGFSGPDNGRKVIQTADGGYLLIGDLDVTASGGEGISKLAFAKRHAGGDCWAIKLNHLGEKQWSHYYGGTFTDTPYDVVQTEDLGYLIVGSSDSDDVDINNNKGTYDFWVVKINATGTLVWEKSFGGSGIDEAFSITATHDGHYMIVGDTRSDDLDVSYNHGAADLWVVKISPDGTLIWEKTYGGTSFDSGRSISKTQDQGFIISGNSRSIDADVSENKGQNDAWIIKIDASGNLIWEKTIGGSAVDLAFNAIELNNNNIIGVGESNSSNEDIPSNKGFSDLLLFKLKQ